MFTHKKISPQVTILITILLVWLTAACTPAAQEPPATLVAIANDTTVLSPVDLSGVNTLQEQPFGTGQMALYGWQNEAGQYCLVAAYLTIVGDQWQTHDTASVACQTNEFIAAYTGNSVVESPFGPPRHTVAYGRSLNGMAVRVIWADGMVSHVSLENGAFLESRAGRWDVERIELLDENNNVMQAEEWSSDTNA